MKAAKAMVEDFSNEEGLPSHWRWVRLGDVISEAQGGFASGARDSQGVIQLRMNNVTTDGHFDWSSFLRVPADEATIERYRLRHGDVLFNNTNSTELVGKSVYFESYEEAIVFSNHFTRLRVAPDALDPLFLSHWLRSEWINGTFARICNRWIGQSAVQRGKLLDLTIPLPSLLEQQRIAAELHDNMQAVASAKKAAEEQLESINRLPGALLRQAFKGGL